MKRDMTLVVCVFAVLAVLECPALLAQAEPARPVANASDPSVQTCDSLISPAQGESPTDAANRLNAWWHCLEIGAGGKPPAVVPPPANMDSGRPAAGAVPGFTESQLLPVNQPDTLIRDPSPNSQPDTFTFRIGGWSKVISTRPLLRESHRVLVTFGLTRKAPPPPIQ
jgi:hypothetical protein